MLPAMINMCHQHILETESSPHISGSFGNSCMSIFIMLSIFAVSLIYFIAFLYIILGVHNTLTP